MVFIWKALIKCLHEHEEFARENWSKLMINVNSTRECQEELLGRCRCPKWSALLALNGGEERNGNFSTIPSLIVSARSHRCHKTRSSFCWPRFRNYWPIKHPAIDPSIQFLMEKCSSLFGPTNGTWKCLWPILCIHSTLLTCFFHLSGSMSNCFSKIHFRDLQIRLPAKAVQERPVDKLTPATSVPITVVGRELSIKLICRRSAVSWT